MWRSRFVLRQVENFDGRWRDLHVENMLLNLIIMQSVYRALHVRWYSLVSFNSSWGTWSSEQYSVTKQTTQVFLKTTEPNLTVFSYWKKILIFQTIIFRRFRKIGKSRLLASFCPSVQMNATTHFPLDGFPWNLIFEYLLKICQEN